jgi:hypothetical protein
MDLDCHVKWQNVELLSNSTAGPQTRLSTIVASAKEKIMKKLSLVGVTVGAALLCAAPFSPHWSQEKNLSLSLDSADARLGRPLTPMSVAGVNRRVHRRAYYGTHAYHHPY